MVIGCGFAERFNRVCAGLRDFFRGAGRCVFLGADFVLLVLDLAAAGLLLFLEVVFFALRWVAFDVLLGFAAFLAAGRRLFLVPAFVLVFLGIATVFPRGTAPDCGFERGPTATVSDTIEYLTFDAILFFAFS